MIPWLLVVELLCTTGKSLSQMVDDRMLAFPCSGEINRRVSDTQALLAEVEATFTGEATLVERVDGLSMSFENWRFNLRSSSTEPLLRLNVESRGDRALMEEKTQALLAIIDA